MSLPSHVYETPFASPNGRKPEAVLPNIVQSRESFLQRTFKLENLIVGGREVKGWVITPAMGCVIAGVFLTFILGTGATVYWRLSDQIRDQRDLIIELKTSLKDKTDAEAEYKRDVKDTLATQKVYFDSLSNQVYALKGILTPEQSRRLEAATKRN